MCKNIPWATRITLSDVSLLLHLLLPPDNLDIRLLTYFSFSSSTDLIIFLPLSAISSLLVYFFWVSSVTPYYNLDWRELDKLFSRQGKTFKRTKNNFHFFISSNSLEHPKFFEHRRITHTFCEFPPLSRLCVFFAKQLEFFDDNFFSYIFFFFLHNGLFFWNDTELLLNLVRFKSQLRRIWNHSNYSALLFSPMRLQIFSVLRIWRAYFLHEPHYQISLQNLLCLIASMMIK